MPDHLLQADPAAIGPQVNDLSAPPYAILQVVIYRDTLGRVLEGRFPHGEIMPKVVFFTTVNALVDTPAGPQPIPVEIPIDGAGVEEAFRTMQGQIDAKGPALARAQVDKLVANAKRHQMAQAGRIQLPR